MENTGLVIQSAVLMLRYLGEGTAADRVEKALRATYSQGKVRTGDLGGTATTEQFADAVLAAMADA